MNPKIFVGAAVAGVAIVIAVVAISGPSIVNELSQKGISPQKEVESELAPLEVKLVDISVLDIDDSSATVQIKFEANNPNSRAILLHVIKYQLYANEQRIATGEIGDRAEGMVAGSNYFTLLTNQPNIISDKITLKNSGNMPELWTSLANNSSEWHVTGDAFYTLSSMTSGGEQEVKFDLRK